MYVCSISYISKNQYVYILYLILHLNNLDMYIFNLWEATEFTNPNNPTNNNPKLNTYTHTIDITYIQLSIVHVHTHTYIPVRGYRIYSIGLPVYPHLVLMHILWKTTPMYVWVCHLPLQCHSVSEWVNKSEREWGWVRASEWGNKRERDWVSERERDWVREWVRVSEVNERVRLSETFGTNAYTMEDQACTCVGVCMCMYVCVCVCVCVCEWESLDIIVL